ncbi:MAG: BolA family transcriptional regulator [Burkholderiales bacterium]|nr:BolA family transcriptional regulator [Burkholderiales bacterium]
MTDTPTLIRERLAALEPELLELKDDSARHAGHAGAREGGGHFSVYIVAGRFSGVPVQRRHRMVYEALGPLMRREIHALALTTCAPEEIDGPQRRKGTG